MIDNGPFWLRHPAHDELQALLAAQSSQELSYPEVGATRGAMPDGYHLLDTAVSLGWGDEIFRRGAASLRSWTPQRAAGMGIVPETPPLAEGQSFVLVTRSFPFWVTIPGRIVWVADEEDRFGFAYGTLPGHPERGEEAFVVERGAEGRVRFLVRAFSRPGHLLTLLGSPLARAAQAKTTRRYLKGMQDAVAG